MSQNNSNDKAAMLAKIETINHVDGFDPAPLAVDYIDLNSNETRKRLPVMAQMAWFRLKYPEGRISVQVTSVKEWFVATARVYPSYKDGPENYLSEATASRSFQADKPTVSPCEWAQTAAIGIALRNAGFGLQFAIAGDEFESVATDELGVTSTQPGTSPAADKATEEDYMVAAAAAPPRELTMEEKYEQALNVQCPITKFGGKTLGEVLILDPNAINWCATKFTGDPAVKEAAQIICEYATQQAS